MLDRSEERAAEEVMWYLMFDRSEKESGRSDGVHMVRFLQVVCSKWRRWNQLPCERRGVRDCHGVVESVSASSCSIPLQFNWRP